MDPLGLIIEEWTMNKNYETPALEEIKIKVQDIMSDSLFVDDDGLWTPLC